jgi:hypothetical protein
MGGITHRSARVKAGASRPHAARGYGLDSVRPITLWRVVFIQRAMLAHPLYPTTRLRFDFRSDRVKAPGSQSRIIRFRRSATSGGRSRYSRPADGRPLSPSEIVMMDNLPAQEVAGVCEAIEATGAMLRHFPPQSIEQSFAKLKAHLRKAAERSIPALWDRIGNNPRHRYPRRANYFRHAGHGSN